MKKKKFMKMVSKVFMSQTDQCRYSEPFPFKMCKDAPEDIGTILWEKLKDKIS